MFSHFLQYDKDNKSHIPFQITQSQVKLSISFHFIFLKLFDVILHTMVKIYSYPFLFIQKKRRNFIPLKVSTLYSMNIFHWKSFKMPFHFVNYYQYHISFLFVILLFQYHSKIFKKSKKVRPFLSN